MKSRRNKRNKKYIKTRKQSYSNNEHNSSSTSLTSSMSNTHTHNISAFLSKMKNKMSLKVPYMMDILKKGSISKNAAGMRISELGSQIKEDYGQLFFYDLVDNAMRVPHWHSDGDEIGLVLDGKIRVTIWNGIDCEKQMFTAEKMGTWFIPRGTLHCLENMSEDKTKFLVCYNNPNTADRDFIDAWKSLPVEILCASTYLSKEDADIVSKQQIKNRLSKFEPTKQLAESINHYSAFSNNFNVTEPVYKSELGEINSINPKNTVNMKMAWQKTILKPGSLRLPHWYTNSNVILYVQKGTGFVTMLDSLGEGHEEQVYHFKIYAGCVLAIPTGFFHSILNIESNNDLEYYEAFMSGITNEITLLKGIQSLSDGVASGALGLSKEHASKMLENKAPEYIVKF